MGVQVDLKDVQSGYLSATTQTANNTLIEEGFNKALDRTANDSNAMQVNLDMGLNKIINLDNSDDIPHAAMPREEILDTIKEIVGNALVGAQPGGGDNIIVEETGQFYREISGANEGQSVFPLDTPYTPGANTLSAYINGVLQVKDLDYLETDELTVTFLTPLTSEDTVQFLYAKTITAVPTNIYTDRVVRVYTNSSGQSIFDIDYNPGNLDVYLNGVKLQRQEDYTADNGETVILAAPVLFNEDVLELTAFSTFSIADHYTKEETYAKDETYSSEEAYNKEETYTKAEVNALLAGSEAAVPVGSIIAKASSVVSTGYLECNGQAVNRGTYLDLFEEIGTVYGAGNGINTFNLPDLRGEFLRGWDSGRGVDPGRGIGTNQAASNASSLSGLVKTDIVGNAPDFGPSNIPTDGTYSDPVQTANNGGTGDDHRLSIALDYTSGDTVPRNVALMYQIKY